jgi:pectinesterase
MRRTTTFLGAGALLLLLCGYAVAPRPITVFLAGDSTMAEKLPEKRPETGWGEHLQRFFDPAAVRVANHARNGRSTRTFIEEGRWQAIVDSLRPGDYVFIQFGHNDGSEEKPDRYTPPADYRANLVRFVGEVQARDATPVLFTPVVRRRFDGTGAFRDAHGVYPDLVREVAAEHRVELIDMHRSSQRVIEQHGPEASRRLFLHLRPNEHANYPAGLEDNTHFSPFGAELMARLAVEGIRDLRLGLAGHLARAGVAKR